MFVPKELVEVDELDKIPVDKKLCIEDMCLEKDKVEGVNLSQKEITIEENNSKEIIVEDKFVNNFINKVKSEGLIFDENDLINFHNSVKSNLLTILTGLSGTGKSKLTEIYAEALGIKNSNQFNMIAVRPFWQDDSDLLGFVDTISNNYHPGDSGLIDTLISANNNKDSLYIIVLDEMNLARVEHYFSQFISVLERSLNDRKIRLYSKEIEPRIYNSNKYSYEIKIPANVRFIGTMNIDESTYQLSDKLIDRANIISLKMCPFTTKNNISNNEVLSSFNKSVSFSEYEEMNSTKNNDLSNSEKSLLWELHEVINDALPTVGLSWRTLDRINNFLKNAIFVKEFDRKIALDYQISQRILPKIRGTEDILHNLINKDEDNNLSGTFYDVLVKHNDLSNYKLTKKILEQKLRELEVNGFAR